MSTKTDLLLGEILNAAACNYISDLHTIKFSNSSLEYISNIPEQRYELEVWKKALRYVTGEELDPKSVDEAKVLLKEK